VYGSTEVPTITVGSIAPGDVEHAAETDGKLGIGNIRVSAQRDSSGAGALLARGPQMLVGYLNPKDEENLFDENGYFHMGDLGRLVDGDYVVITGREKDIIIRNGENISPKEIEDILIQHPAVAEIAICGLPSERTGELACAFVVPNGDARPSVGDFAEWLQQYNVAKFKFPERVVLTRELPRNVAGKVLKHVLKAEYLAAAEA